MRGQNIRSVIEISFKILKMILTSGKYPLVLIIESLLFLGQANGYHNRSYNEEAYTFVYPGAENGINNGYNPIKLSFTDAQQWCEQNVPGSTLLTIVDRNMQMNIKTFAYRLEQQGNSIRVNGRFHSNGSWSWVNGHEFKNLNGNGESQNVELFQNGAVESYNHTIRAYHSSNRYPSICEYPSPSTECDSRLNERCRKVKQTYRTWYEARNDCLRTGGDLASFDALTDSEFNSSLKIPSRYYSRYSTYTYWIGIQNGVWRWEDTGSAIAYTSWLRDYPYLYRPTGSDRCICINGYAESRWIVCSCDSKLPFFCLLNRTESSQTTTSNSISHSSLSHLKTATSSTTNHEVKLKSTPTSATTNHEVKLTSTATSSTTNHDVELKPDPEPEPTSFDGLTLGVGISCAFGVIAIVIVVIVVIIQRKKSSRNQGLKSSRTATNNCDGCQPNDAAEAKRANQRKESNATEFYETIQRPQTSEDRSLQPIYQQLQFKGDEDCMYEIV